jgi:Kef-type K+ transport system membrane component KefB
MRVSAMQVAIVTAVGPFFGLSRIQSARAGLLLAAGGEFAFVALYATLPL